MNAEKKFAVKTLFPNFRLAISLLDQSLQEEIKERHSTPRQSGRFNGQRHFTQYFRLCGKPTDTICLWKKKVKNIINIMERRKQENVEIILSRLRK